MDSGQNDDQNIAYRIWVGTIVTIVPATFAVVLRFLGRHVSRAGFWWDDYTIAIALVRCALDDCPALLMCLALGVQLGYGYLAMGTGHLLGVWSTCSLPFGRRRSELPESTYILL
jgi:hypothetical protein